MQIELVNYFNRENIGKFKEGALKWQFNTIILVTGGEYIVRFASKQKPIVLRKNDIVFIPVGTELERSVGAPTSYCHISFHLQADDPFCRSASIGKLVLPEEQTAAIFKSLVQALVLPDNRELMTHIVERVFVENYLFGKTKKTNFRIFSEEITSTVNYMNRNLDKKIDIDELAARVYLSHSGLIWKFKKELNTTPLQYLNMLRLRNAKQLLLNHSYSISEISEMCGYSNPYYFTNIFHQQAGMSPTEFRKYHLEKKG